MISDEAAVRVALETAEEGMAAGEMPVGAAVFLGEDLIARAWTQEKEQKRRIVHADLLAMERADKVLGFARRTHPLTLAVNLEPCLMCMGAAITLGIENVVYALESPNDGAAELLTSWTPPVVLPFFRAPGRVKAGVLRDEARRQFSTYAAGDGPAGMRAWARSLALQ